MLARKPSNSRPARLLVPLVGQVVRLALQRDEVDVADGFDHQLEAAGIAQAVDRRRAEDVRLGLRESPR